VRQVQREKDSWIVSVLFGQLTYISFNSGLTVTSSVVACIKQAIGMTQVKTKFDANTNTSKIIRTFQTVWREVIWILCFHWPNITTCGRYPCGCVMPERFFVFTCCSANASISASRRKRKNLDPCAFACLCAYAGVKTVFTDGEIRIIVLALVLASLVKTRVEGSEQTGDSSDVDSD